jgi:hypothetical protein
MKKTILLLTFIIIFSVIVIADCPDGMVSYWKFEGNARDYVGNNNGTITGATFTNGHLRNALSFDGVSDRIQILNSDSLSFADGVFTISGWVKTDSSGRTVTPSDTFDGRIIDTTKWGSLPADIVMNNNIYFDVQTQSTYSNLIATSLNKLTGNFDIQVDFSDYSTSGTASFRGAHFSLAFDNGDHILLVRRFDPNLGRQVYQRHDYVSGKWHAGNFVHTSHTSGKLRITRSGSTFTASYWTGSSWATLSASSTKITTTTNGRVFLTGYIHGTGSGYSRIRYDNFVVNSGSTTYRAPQTILDKQPTDSTRGLSFRINPDGFLEGYTWDDGEAIVRSNQAINDGTWRHVTWTSDGTTQRLFIDGEESGYSVQNTPKTNLVNNANLRIGRNNLNAKEFDGSIDELVIYNRSLTPEEVGELYSRSANNGLSYCSVQPNATTFGGTDINTIPDLTQVQDFIITKSEGSVKWNNDVYLFGQNLDSNINLGADFISLNVNNLHSSLNTSAEISFVVDSCSNPTIYYVNEGFYDNFNDIKSNGIVCPPEICSDITCNDNTLTFTAAHFDGFGGEGDPLSDDEPIPEFSTMGIILAVMIIGIFSMFIWKKKD